MPEKELAKVEIVNVLWGGLVLLGGLLATVSGFIVKLAIQNITSMRDTLRTGIADLVKRQEDWEKESNDKFKELYDSRNAHALELTETKTILHNIEKEHEKNHG